jgi:hypothetical protein
VQVKKYLRRSLKVFNPNRNLTRGHSMQSQHIPFLALALVLGGAIQTSPTSAAPTKIAQMFRQNAVLRSGETIDVRLNSNETLYISTGERKAADLLVDQNVISETGVVLIPQGAIISGEFVPVSGGSKFVAKTLTSRGGTVRMVAESALINDVKDPRESSFGSIAGDAAIGAAAGALLGGLFGGRSIVATENILGGAAAGAIVGNVTAPQVVVIEASQPLSIITRRNLTFRTQDSF